MARITDRALSWCFVFCLAACCTKVHAQGLVEADSTQRARSLKELGNQAMLDMRYVDALAFYEQSKALTPAQTGLLYSIARAQQMLGEFPAALTALEEFDLRASAEQKAAVGQLDVLFRDLRSRVATLNLTCEQAGARVLVRDQVLGITPLAPDTRVSAGAARVQIELEGFFPVVREVVLPPQGTLALEVKLLPRSTSALLRVRTAPEHAEVSIDGQRIGTASPLAEWALPAGTHQVSARREGFDEASTPVVLNAGTSRDLTVQLSPTRPVYKRWWFWLTTGVVVAGGAALTAALLVERDPGRGSIGEYSAPLSVGL